MSFSEHIGPIFRAAMEILREEGRPMQPAEVREAIAKRVVIDSEHEKPNAHGQVRWHAQLGFRTGEAASLGWMTKRNGWAITGAGIQALEEFPGDELYRALGRQYRARRQAAEARTYRDPRWNLVREALARVSPGFWTTYGDLADLVGMSAQSVGGFMAEAGAPGVHRVLQSAGRISPGFRWPDPERTDDPREMLQREGVKFDQAGRADPAGRITVDKFRAMLSVEEALTAPEPAAYDEPDVAPDPFDQFQQNIGYARQLVRGGRSLEHLRVGAFDVTDLYRAAWSQSVAALDHWVTREIINRGVDLALRPGTPRPAKFDKLTMPVALFERIHHHYEPLAEVFRDHLEREFGFKTFQSPEKIQEGFAHVSEIKLWVKVAQILTEQDPESPVTSDEVRARMRGISWRRNNIAHTADYDPEQPGQKLPITAKEVEETINWLESIAIAILLALGDPPPAVDYDAVPIETGTLGAAPGPVRERQLVTPHAKREWDEESLIQAITKYCPEDVARTLLEVYRHAERHSAFRGYYYGQGEYPSVTARFSIGNDEIAVWSIYTGVRKAVLSINFEWMRDQGVTTEDLVRLANALSRLPSWERLPLHLEAANYAARVSLDPVALAERDTANVVIDAFNALLASPGGGA